MGKNSAKAIDFETVTVCGLTQASFRTVAASDPDFLFRVLFYVHDSLERARTDVTFLTDYIESIIEGN
jgi:CRP-like cAMP-binding protein